VHVITFYSQGPPHDTALNLSLEEREFREKIAVHFDSYRAWSHADVMRVAPRYVRAFADGSMRNNPGYEAIGYGAFKPYLMLDALSRIEHGDLLVFHDVNLRKYPDYALSAPQLPAMARFIIDTLGADLFMPLERPFAETIKRMVKTSVVRELAAGFTVDMAALQATLDKVTRRMASKKKREFLEAQAQAPLAVQRRMAGLFEFPLLNAHLVIARKSAQSDALLREWLRAVERVDWIAPEPNPARHPHFHQHTAEQALFTTIAAKHVLNGTLPPDYPRYHFGANRPWGGRRVMCDHEAMAFNSTLGRMLHGIKVFDRRLVAAIALSRCPPPVELVESDESRRCKREAIRALTNNQTLFRAAMATNRAPLLEMAEVEATILERATQLARARPPRAPAPVA
jgi:hypothetical protein